MWKRIGTFVVIPAVLLAGVLAFQSAEHVPDATSATNAMSRQGSAPLAPVGEMLRSDIGERLPADHPPIGAPANDEALPPGHPPIGAAASPQGSLPAAATDPPAVVWTMPGAWQEAPNPNAMRLATYRAPGGVEIAVSRAGGSTEANIQRWIAQFDDVGRDGRAEKTVHGLHVVIVDVAGTYASGGVAMGAPAESKSGWALVGAIVESRSPSYFFKMTGPATAVRAARSQFDRFIDGITPS